MSDDAPTVTGETSPEPGGGRRWARGDVIGGFIVVDELGAGGMGVVLAAYDPGLDRKVALKLVRADHATDVDRVRLEREAQAMARVVHPNVVTVYQAGAVENQLYVAMELVEGGTLRAWLRARPRGWREVLDAFAQAGRGLAAAHHAGLVHRDFKPDNVLVGADGRVRVTDFGLVAAPFEPPPDAAALGDSPLALGLTSTGRVVGTPSYMAPEQHRGEAAGPAADQFAFCVALYEGLWGKRPFSGRSLDELAAAIAAGKIAAPPPGARVPAWVADVVRRGLAADPAARHPSMDALLAALARDPTARRRNVLAAVAIVVAAGALGVVAARGPAAARPCAGGAARLAGVWDDALRARSRAAFAGSGAPGALEAWERFAAALDGYAASWTGAYTQVCEATRVHGAQSEAALDLRMACLDRRRAEVAALAELYQRPDAAMVAQAALAAFKLARPERCAAPEIVASRVEPPPAQAAPAVAAMRAVLARGDALLRAGRYDAALAVDHAALAAARVLGYAPLEAEALYGVGITSEFTAEPAEARAALLRAVRAAKASHLAEVEADAWTELVWVTGKDLARYEDAHQVAEVAAGAVAALGDDAARAAMLDHYLADVLSAEGRQAEALAVQRRTLARREALYGAFHPDVAKTLNNLAGTLYYLNRLPEAEVAFRRAVEIFTATLGPSHIRAGQARANVAAVLSSAGKLDAAEAELARALEIQVAALGADALPVGLALTNLGNLQRERGRRDAARQSFERAVAILEQRRGAEHPDLAYALQGLGELGSDARDGARALPYVERALRLREAAKVDPVRIADSQVAVARALLQPGATHDVARARRLLAAARAVLVAAGEPGADILALLDALEREHAGQLTAARTSPPPARSRSPR